METNKEKEITEENVDWLDLEEKELKKNQKDFESLPSLILEENKVTEFIIDFSKPFETWEDKENKSFKAKIPVTYQGKKMLFWLNKRNPVYRKIIEAGKKGRINFKLTRTGQQQNTKFILLD